MITPSSSPHSPTSFTKSSSLFSVKDTNSKINSIYLGIKQWNPNFISIAWLQPFHQTGLHDKNEVIPKRHLCHISPVRICYYFMIFIHSVSYILSDERSTLDLISYFLKKKIVEPLFKRSCLWDKTHHNSWVFFLRQLSSCRRHSWDVGLFFFL